MTRRITAVVYEADGTTLAGANLAASTLGSDSKRTFLKDLSAEGTYSLEILLGHADEALLTDGRIVRFLIDGTARWQGLVEDRNLTLADPNSRKAGRTKSCRGRGTLGLFEWAILYPELGLGRISPDTRYFNPASADFDVSGWGTATSFHTQGTTDDTDAYYSFPQGFPDPDAEWIGPSDGITSLPAPIGFWWVVKTCTVPVGEGGDYRLSVGSDDGVQVFVDGDEVYAESTVGLWGRTHQLTIPLDEGTHRIACRVENFDRPSASTNATALVLSLAKELAGGAVLDDPIVATDATWKFLQVTSTEPGMTPGKFLDVILTEAQTNGFLDGVTWDFDETDDSNGDPWPDERDWSFPVGTPYIEIIRHLVDEHACDVEMSATGLVLHAYISKGTDLSGSITAAYGTNLSRLAFSQKGPGPNVALMKTAENRWVEKRRSSAVSAWGARGVHLSMGSAPSADAADRQSEAFFDDKAEPVDAITDMQIEEVNAVPFDDFDVGDTISATGADGSAADCRVHGIRVAEDNAGVPIWAPDLVRV